MEPDVSHIIVQQWRAIRNEIHLVKADTQGIKERLRSHDASILDLKRSDVHQYEDQARQQVSLNGLQKRIGPIEQRRDLS